MIPNMNMVKAFTVLMGPITEQRPKVKTIKAEHVKSNVDILSNFFC